MRRPLVILFALTLAVTACAKKKAPVTQPAPPPEAAAPAPAPAPAPPQRVEEALPVPEQPLAEDAIANKSLDDLNRDSPLKPAFFKLDSADLDDAGRMAVQADADILKKYATWQITIEGHCDERGTAEYNLALGERRAVGVKTYLVSLGISPDRIRTVSYGKEFPFDPGHDEAAYAQNRRAHFVVTAK
ncbi:MAG TPA: peptidoglycan-associated lipoprotein Pal [Vicinamibacterales bacterium]|nr:peptidoglycan-associated lipoprotein Pal [Vicinamibacterales bacterium]